MMKGFHKLLFFMVLKCYYGIRPAIDLFAQLTVSPLNKPNSFHMCHFHMLSNMASFSAFELQSTYPLVN